MRTAAAWRKQPKKPWWKSTNVRELHRHIRFLEETNATREEGIMDGRFLRTVSTETLQRELKLRRSCIDCGTEYSSGFHPAGVNRIRCADCQKKK